MTKRIMKVGIPAALLILFAVLTAVLCCSTVFHGTYKGENPLKVGCGYKVTFSNDTVTYKLTGGGEWQDVYHGFYKNTTDGIELNLTEPDSRTVKFKRKNAFTIIKTVDNLNSWSGDYGGITTEMELKCHGAIWLQVFYSVGMAASAVVLIVQTLKQRKAKR